MINFSSANIYGEPTLCKALKNINIDQLSRCSKSIKGDTVSI